MPPCNVSAASNWKKHCPNKWEVPIFLHSQSLTQTNQYELMVALQLWKSQQASPRNTVKLLNWNAQTITNRLLHHHHIYIFLNVLWINYHWWFLILLIVKCGMHNNELCTIERLCNAYLIANTIHLPKSLAASLEYIVEMFPPLFLSVVSSFLSFSGGSTEKGSRPLRLVWSCTRMFHLEMLVFPPNYSPKTLTPSKVPTHMSLLCRNWSSCSKTAVHRGSWNALVSHIVLFYSPSPKADFQDR